MDSDQSNTIPASVHAFAKRLSPRAQQMLSRWKWTVRPERRVSHAELQRCLAEKGIPEWPGLWPIEEAFGGTGIAGLDLDFGVTHLLPYYEREELIDDSTGRVFVPAGEWGSFSVLLGSDGGLYQVTTPDMIEKLEPSFESFLENQAMARSFRTWAPNGFVADLSPGFVAPALATQRAVPPVTEASNEFHRWWQDGTWTLFEAGENGAAVIWAKTLEGLVAAIDAAADIEPRFDVRPRPSYEQEHITELTTDEVAALAPTLEHIRSRSGARRFALLGEPSIYEGKPPSTGDVWISGEGETLQIEVLERREGKVVNYWQLTPNGSHALLMSRYGKG